MLIKNGKKSNSSTFTPSPFKDEAGKRTISKDAPPLRLREVPNPRLGTRIPTGKELFKKINGDPGLRDAIGLVEKVYGCETGIRRAVRKQRKGPVWD